jgi:hypothetical protein
MRIFFIRLGLGLGLGLHVGLGLGLGLPGPMVRIRVGVRVWVRVRVRVKVKVRVRALGLGLGLGLNCGAQTPQFPRFHCLFVHFQLLRCDPGDTILLVAQLLIILLLLLIIFLTQTGVLGRHSSGLQHHKGQRRAGAYSDRSRDHPRHAQGRPNPPSTPCDHLEDPRDGTDLASQTLL